MYLYFAKFIIAFILLSSCSSNINAAKTYSVKSSEFVDAMYYSYDTLFVNDIVDSLGLKEDTEILLYAIEVASTSNMVLRLDSVVYKISDVDISHSVKIIGHLGKTVLRPINRYNVFITTSSSVYLQDVIIDGNGLVNTAIYSTDDLAVINSSIVNIMGDKRNPANGIRHIPSNKSLLVNGSVFKNIYGHEDGHSGNTIGAHRAIITKGEGYVRISNSRFIDIEGSEDGDCIHIHTVRDKGGDWGSAGDVLIQNNYFENFGKRAIKLQASDVIVRNNHIVSNRIYNDRRPLTAVGIFGNNNICESNTIYLENAETGIMTSTGKGNLIQDNKISFGSKSRPLAAIFWGREAKSNEVLNNIIEGPEDINRFRFSKFIDPKSRARIRTSNSLNEEL
jgi:hypothetical protein